MEGIAPSSSQAEYLKMFNFVPASQPTSSLERIPQAMTPSSPRPDPTVPTTFTLPPTFPPQTVTIAKNGKRRIKPVLISHLSTLEGEKPSGGDQPSIETLASTVEQLRYQLRLEQSKRKRAVEMLEELVNMLKSDG